MGRPCILRVCRLRRMRPPRPSALLALSLPFWMLSRRRQRRPLTQHSCGSRRVPLVQEMATSVLQYVPGERWLCGMGRMGSSYVCRRVVVCGSFCWTMYIPPPTWDIVVRLRFCRSGFGGRRWYRTSATQLLGVRSARSTRIALLRSLGFCSQWRFLSRALRCGRWTS